MSLINNAYEGEKFNVYNKGFEDGRQYEFDKILAKFEAWENEKKEKGHIKAAIATGYAIRFLKGQLWNPERKEKLEAKNDI